jgi:hypothetical protein
MRVLLIGLWLFAVAFLIARRWVNQLSRTIKRNERGGRPPSSGA